MTIYLPIKDAWDDELFIDCDENQITITIIFINIITIFTINLIIIPWQRQNQFCRRNIRWQQKRTSFIPRCSVSAQAMPSPPSSPDIHDNDGTSQGGRKEYERTKASGKLNGWNLPWEVHVLLVFARYDRQQDRYVVWFATWWLVEKEWIITFRLKVINI